MIEGLTFRESDHTYAFNGQPVPNVTRVLSLITDFSKIDPAVLERARQEGVDMHRCVELYSKGELDEPTLPEWLRPRLDAYKRFLAETGFEIDASEERLYHSGFRYAGTADLFGRFTRFKVGRNEVQRTACIDLKRSFYAGRAIGLQTAAYAEAWANRGNPDVQVRAALQLRDDGSYRLQVYSDPSDFHNFLSCLIVTRLKDHMK